MRFVGDKCLVKNLLVVKDQVACPATGEPSVILGRRWEKTIVPGCAAAQTRVAFAARNHFRILRRAEADVP
jgi:hypothetical protein